MSGIDTQRGSPSAKRASAMDMYQGGRLSGEGCSGGGPFSNDCFGVRGRWCIPESALHSVVGFLLPAFFSRLAGAATEQAETLQRLEGGVTVDGLLQLLLGLLLVLAMIGVIAWLLRRFPFWNSTANGALKVIATLPVGQRERVMVIQVGDRQLLIGVSPGQVEMLHVLEHPLPDEAVTLLPQGGSFARRLAAAMEKRKK